jgi:beta-N-acetylhexosaminidase
MDRMSLEKSIARMFCIGFPGPRVTDAARGLVARGVRSVVLFARNVESPAQVAGLCTELKSLTGGGGGGGGAPLLTCIDQEGGRVRRLRDGFTHIPSMRALGQTADAALAHDVGRVLARELRAVNIDVNFAPTLDVDTNPANPVIGDRSFGSDCQLVSRMGTALIRGLQENGVAACGKHFPGHGDTSQDSHHDLPRLPHPIERLEQIELPPFRAAVNAGVAMIMTSHVVFEPIDPDYPATMSEPVLHGILRERMKFDGVIISDDLEMKAISANFGIEEVLVRGANAGVDLFAIAHDPALQNRAIDAMIKAVARGDVPAERVAEANRRIDALMARYAHATASAGQQVGQLNSAEHRAVMARIGALVEENGDDGNGNGNGNDPTRVVG